MRRLGYLAAALLLVAVVAYYAARAGALSAPAVAQPAARATATRFLPAPDISATRVACLSTNGIMYGTTCVR